MKAYEAILFEAEVLEIVDERMRRIELNLYSVLGE
jgi:hypothetical protein